MPLTDSGARPTPEAPSGTSSQGMGSKATFNTANDTPYTASWEKNELVRKKELSILNPLGYGNMKTST